MRKAAATAIATIAVMVMAVAPVAGGGYTHGHGSGTCWFVPSTGVEGQPFTVYASGLPTDRTVYLIVTNYEWPTHSYGPLAIQPDGTYSGSYTVDADGKVKFAFATASTNATRLGDLQASCTITLASA